jgi:hypothetical protein
LRGWLILQLAQVVGHVLESTGGRHAGWDHPARMGVRRLGRRLRAPLADVADGDVDQYDHEPEPVQDTHQ